MKTAVDLPSALNDYTSRPVAQYRPNAPYVPKFLWTYQCDLGCGTGSASPSHACRHTQP